MEVYISLVKWVGKSEYFAVVWCRPAARDALIARMRQGTGLLTTITETRKCIAAELLTASPNLIRGWRMAAYNDGAAMALGITAFAALYCANAY